MAVARTQALQHSQRARLVLEAHRRSEPGNITLKEHQSKIEIMLTTLLTTALLSACAQFPPRSGTSWNRSARKSIAQAAAHKTKPGKYAGPSSYVVHGERYHVLPSCQGYDKRGIASWYGNKFHGQRTSSGESYNMNAMTAAQKTLPLLCNVRVTNLKNGKSVVVKVNDRGPFVKNRLIDLSHKAAAELGIIGTGTGLVEVQSINLKPTTSPVATAAYSAPAASAQKATAVLAPDSPAADTNPAIYLQIGAFAKHINADRLKRRLEAADINHVVLQADATGPQTLYRVRVGPMVGVTVTDNLSDRLEQAGFGVPQVVIVSQSLAKR